MINSYLLTALRNIIRHKGFSLLNILGLSLSMAVCMLIIVILVDQYSYDKQHLEKHQIYRVQSINNMSDISLNRYASTAYPLAEELANNYPFIEEAVIVLRTSWEEASILSVDDFVDDFIKFIENSNVIETGFSETILKKESMILGDIATFLVLYEALIPGSGRPPQKGVDSFSLIKKNGEWKIISILNEIPSEMNPIPVSLMD